MVLIENEELTYKISLTDNINNPYIIGFLMNDKRAGIYHHPAWIKSLSCSYGGKAFYLLMTNKDTNKIEGIAPFILFNQESETKKKIISLPFTNYCDFILPDNYDIQILFNQIESTFGKICEYDLRMLDETPLEGFSNSNEYLVHIIEMKPTLEETYNSFGKRSIRRFIKKADENKLSFRLGETEEDFKIFYDLEVKLRKSIGLPPAPFYFFHNIWTYLKNDNMIFLPIVSINDKPIAASLVLVFKDRIYFEYTGLDKKYKDLYGNHKLHWEMIKIAHENYNVKYVELGRVSIEHRDLIFFKENWNAKPFKIYHKRSLSHYDNNFLARMKEIVYPSLVKINKKLPANLLKIEGRLMYKYLKIFLFVGLLIK